RMANSLEAQGYVDAIPFDWAAEAGLPIPGLAVAAGDRAAAQITRALTTLQASGQYPAGTVFDLQPIGPSRRSGVLTHALPPLAAGGYWRLTYLDPHPSHAPNEADFSAANNSIGSLALSIANEFQAAAQDPLPLIVPSNVADVQVYYERTPASQILETAEES